MTELEAKGENWFDLEINEGNLTSDLKTFAVKVFYFWQRFGILKLPNQKITRWRPRKGIVLITSQVDLIEMKNIFPKDLELPKKFAVLFEFENIYRIYLF